MELSRRERHAHHLHDLESRLLDQLATDPQMQEWFFNRYAREVGAYLIQMGANGPWAHARYRQPQVQWYMEEFLRGYIDRQRYIIAVELVARLQKARELVN